MAARRQGGTASKLSAGLGAINRFPVHPRKRLIVSFVFVYGTLKRGHRNHGLLQAARFAGAATARGFILFDLGPFPGIVPAAAEDAVPGELFEVDAAVLADLDRLEDEGSLYSREQVEIEGRQVWLYVYLGGTETATQIDEWLPSME